MTAFILLSATFFPCLIPIRRTSDKTEDSWRQYETLVNPTFGPAGLAIAASVLAVSSALAGEITLFENPAFGGRRIILTASVANFDRGSSNDRASSMMIGS